MLASMTGFRRREEAVYLDQGSPVPLGFVFQLADELTPSHITDGFRKTVVLDQVLDGQALHADDLVFVHDSCAELVLVVPSPIIDAGVNTSDLEPCLVAVLRTFLFLGMPTLCFRQSLLILLEEAGIADTLTSGKSHHGFDTEVKTDHLRRDGKWFDVFLYQDGNEVAVCAILGDRDRAGFDTLGKRPMPVDIQRLIHLGQSQCAIFPLEGIGGIGSRLAILLFLEGGIVGASRKEVDKSTIKVSQGLLQGHRGNVFEPGILFLEVRQHARQIVVGEVFTTFFVGRGAGMQSPVIDETSTSERLSKNDLLLSSGIEPELICSLRLAHLLAFLASLHMLLNGGQNFAIERAIMLFCYRSYLFQQMDREPDGKRFYHLFHVAILTLTWLHVKGLTPLPKPQKRNGPYIPRMNDGGFTGRSYKRDVRRWIDWNHLQH